jgi:hypothetical protein
MILFSYIITHDTGFAPNPFFGYCTLANCKPVIRRTAKIGDWIVGISANASGNKIIYAMKVQEILSYKEYFENKKFRCKKPDFSSGSTVRKLGDNIYQPLPSGGFKQLQSMHSEQQCGQEDFKRKAHDLSGKNVLISKEFIYFGKNAIPVPRKFSKLKVGRAYKNHFSDKFISDFSSFINSRKKGVLAAPTEWPLDDLGWKIKICKC